MPEQDFITIPDQLGTPTQIAADDASGAGVGPFAEQVSLANLTAELRALNQNLSVLGPAQDALSGRLRVVIDAISANLTLAAVSKVTTIGGFGGPGSGVAPIITDAAYLPLELMAMSWADNVRGRIV
jgi:hypothetical protein